MKRLFILSALLVFLVSCKKEHQPAVIEMSLHDNWEFSQVGENLWNPATVPGTIHTDLFKNNLIPHPFEACNEKELQWIGQKDWVYRTTFDLSSDLMQRQNLSLVFEGLDTYASVKLNDNKILIADNMHRLWEVDVKSLLREKDNTLEIVFQSAENRFLADSAALGYPVPGGRWVLARKAAYHFGWDWGPKFITAGIWKPVYLKAYQDFSPIGIHVFTSEIVEDKAVVKTMFEIKTDEKQELSLQIKGKKSGKVFFNEKTAFSPEITEYQGSFSIEKPVLWWSNGLGEPHVYELEVSITSASGYFWKKDIPFGVRTLEVVAEPDQYGRSLYVKLNGHPVFTKGANYIPQHSFLPELTDADYYQVIDDALKSNMNMLRVWGGGVYQDERFYELCIRKGLMVWQDFMFACAMYPGEAQYLDNVKQEAEYQVKRLRNYSNIALWCGNNEVDEAWHNWGFQKTHKINPTDSAFIWQSYLKIFHEILPNAVAAHDGRYYLSTSPLHGWGREESMKEGSSHYWGVWWGLQPFEKYLEKVPRFMSEFGFQAAPALSSIRSFQAEEEDYLYSPSLKCHQKHPTGYETITTYLQREKLESKNLTQLIYFSQLVQAHGMGIGLEAQRRAKPRCMGSLYWQHNDCWPVTSWSGIDVNGNWKAFQYTVRELFKDIMVSVIQNQGQLEVFLVSDKIEDVEGTWILELKHFSGETIEVKRENISLPANASLEVFKGKMNELFASKNQAEWIVNSRFETKQQTYSNNKFAEKIGALKLPKSNVSWSIEPAKDGFNIQLQADAFAAHLHLFLKDHHAWFDNNFFHLWPGEKVTVYCKTALSVKDFEKQLQVAHLEQYLQ